MDPRYRLMGAFDAVGLPLTLFFDAEGQMVAAQTGEISRAELLRRMAELSGETD